MTAPSGRREQRKQETRRAIQSHALRMFLADGYDATTVEAIAAAAGVSHMTFFRHFPTKESVVESDDYDPLVAQVIRDRPVDEDPLTAIHRGLVGALRAMSAAEHDALRVRTRLVVETPALRARLWENQYATQELFAAALADRETTPGPPDQPDPPELRLRVLAAVALAVLTTALTTWATSDAGPTLPDLVDAAFTALPPGTAG